MAVAQEIVDISSPADCEGSRRAAQAILDRDDPSGEIDRLYPILMKHQTLLTAMAHLERAGANLERLTLSTALFRSLFPLNVLLPLAEQAPADRVPLASIRRHLDNHLLLLRRIGSNIADLGDQVPVVFLFGRAIEAAHPQYLHRVGYDIDVLVPHMDSALRLVRYLREQLGLVLSHCRISRLSLGWLAHFGCRAQTEDGHLLSIDVIVRGRPLGEGPGVLPPVHFEQLFPRSRRLEWWGRSICIPSVEDMLLTLADKIQRHGWISRKDCNDVRVILECEKGGLDWDYLQKEAVHHQLRAVLHFLITDAELQAGRKLVPPGRLARIAPGRLESRLARLSTPDGQRRQGGLLERHWSRHWTKYFLLKYALSGLRKAGIAALVARDEVQRRLFRRELLLAGTKAPRFFLSLLSVMRGRVGSLCQLRHEAELPADGCRLSADVAAGINRAPAGMDAACVHLLKQAAEMVPLGADLERACSRMDGKKRALLRMAHSCASFSFSIGATPDDDALPDGPGGPSPGPVNSNRPHA